MSTPRHPKPEPLGKETKPFVHLPLPFERPFYKTFPEEPIIGKFDITMEEFEKRLRYAEQAQPLHLNDKSKRVIMKEIEKIPAMWSGRDKNLQKQYYKTVAHMTYKRTGLLFTAAQIVNYFKQCKDNLRVRLQKSIKNMDSPSQTEMKLEKWKLYPMIRFFRRNMYTSESKLRNLVARSTVIDLDSLEDFPDDEEDDITRVVEGVVQEDDSSVGGNETNGNIQEVHMEDALPRMNQTRVSPVVHQAPPTPAEFEDVVIEQVNEQVAEHEYDQQGHPNTEYIYLEPQYAQHQPQLRAPQFITSAPMRFAPYKTERAFQGQMEIVHASNRNSPSPIEPEQAPQSRRALDIASFCHQATNIVDGLAENDFRILMKLLYEAIYTINFQEFKTPEEFMEHLLAKNRRPNRPAP